MAETFAEDYKAMSGKTLKVVSGVTPKAGDISFTLTKDQSKGLQDEGYLMDISDYITCLLYTSIRSLRRNSMLWMN